jgi:aryl-alcohol dehydrogenase-like predicted oxidoreductase
MAVEVRAMGSQGMKSSMQGYGCMGLTAFYGKPLADEAAVAVMERAYELGVTHFDTAEAYQGDDPDGTKRYNEEVVGKFAAKVGKDKITIATKYFPGEDRAQCTPEQVRSALDGSLKRLGLDCVDLYYLHRIPSDEALTSWMETAKVLVQEGKCKYLGISEATAAQIRAAHAIHPLTAIQQEWSLLVRNLETELVPTCRELGIGIVAYSPLCRGFTSGLVKTKDDWSKVGNDGGAATGFQSMCPHLGGDNVAANAKLLQPLEEKAAELGVTPAQLSLAWVNAQGDDVFPIPGTTKLANLESNVGAAKLALTLSKDDFDSLGKQVDFAKLAGDRYPGHLQGMCFESK